MKQRKAIFIVSSIFSVYLLLSIMGISAGIKAQQTSLQGHIYGTVIIPKEEMARIPNILKNQKFGREIITDFPEGHREVQVGIEGWTVSIGQSEAVTDSEGNFLLTNLMPGHSTLTISLQGVKIWEQHLKLSMGENFQDIIFRRNIKQIFENMGGAHKKTGEIKTTATQFPCLDDNYLCILQFRSDCYKNLMRGNLYCWAESIGNVMDLGIGRWCNGSRNCSVFIGHSQYRHCDWF